MSLDYTNSIPLYIQLKDRIEQNVINGVYSGKIPSEREIMDEFYVSRSTVRQAIGELVREGVLEKRPGRGTFVSLKPIDDWLGSISNTYETIHQMGLRPGAKVVHKEVAALAPHLQKITGLTEAYHIKRIRYADDIPAGVENNYYPKGIGQDLASYDLNDVALYDFLESELGITLKEAEQIIRAATIKKEDAKWLQISESSPVLHVNRKLVDSQNEFITYQQSIYRADMYSFKIKMARHNK